MATVWTLLILAACFIPGNEIPEVHVPLIDKWVHFVLFGVFSFLWLRAHSSRRPARLVAIFFIGVAFGYGVEVLQGALHGLLGRTYSPTDTLADAVGSALGVLIFAGIYRWRENPADNNV